MALICVDQPWYEQPFELVDLSDFGRQAGAFVHAGGGLRDHVTGRFPSVDTSAVRFTPRGVARDYSGTQNTRIPGGALFSTAGPMTVACVIDVDALTNYGAIAACQNSPSTRGWELRVGSVSPTDGNLLFHRAGELSLSTNIRQWRPSTIGLVSAGTKSLFVAVTHDSSLGSGPAPDWYVGTSKYGSTAVTGTLTGSFAESSADLWLGRRSEGTTQLDGAIEWFFYAPRALSETEVWALRDNAYGLMHAPRRIWVPQAAASGLPTLGTVSASAITSSGFRPSVTYTY